jgi:hypothetical protein
MTWKYYNPKTTNLFTEKKFLFTLGCKEGAYKALVTSKYLHYFKEKKLKKDGIRFREIYKPDKKLKVLLKKINKILSKGSFPPTIHCGPKGRSIITATRKHKNFSNHISLDIDSFFDSIQTHVTKKALIDAGFNVQITDLIVSACVEDDKLPQGFPTSSILSALVISQCIEDFYQNFSSKNVALSVYADDILLSSNDRVLISEAENFIEEKLLMVGLRLNKNKRETGRKGERFLWLGLQINPWVAVPRKKLAELQQKAYLFKRTGNIPLDFKPKNGDNPRKSWKRSIRGKVLYSRLTNHNKLHEKITLLL